MFSNPFMSEAFTSTEGVGPVDLTSGYSIGDGDPFVLMKATWWRTEPIKLDMTCCEANTLESFDEAGEKSG